ncbi:MAG: hypothetical protein J6V72_05170 [Kiritimatiellae bacterium]|nr:hypothetical protein [Kiritimatiellia bacterium]
MHKLITLTTLAAVTVALCGCQTRIVAVKHPEVVTPIESVVEVDGTNRVVTTNAIISSGGWEASARSPLWATEALSGLDLGVATNGTVYLKLDQYNRDLSTNAVLVVQSLSELAADVAGKVTAAICAYYGGGAVSATSKLGELTIKDITGKVQAKLAKKGITDANCADCDPAAIAKEVCEDCCADCTP